MNFAKSTLTRRERLVHRIIIARGDDVHSFVLRKWMIGLAVLLCAAVTFWLCATTAYIFFRDDVLAGMVSRHTRIQQAYEDRIAAMRLQIDRISSRQLVDQETIASRMDEVMRRQGQIELRTQSLGTLLEKARQSGLSPKEKSEDNLTTGAIAPASRKAPSRGTDDYAAALNRIEHHMTRLAVAQDHWLNAAEEKAQGVEQKYRAVLGELGVNLEVYGVKRAQKPQQGAAGLGGPFIPVQVNGQARDVFSWRVEALRKSLSQISDIRQALVSLPLRKPIDGEMELTSGFGSRTDPFLGVLAFHAGLDFRAERGELIRATAAGKVDSAGREAGYGLMVEVDHGNGLATRYGHMSQILVKAGDHVQPGSILGRVGSTGRSTGPHLHYETRVNDEPVNPDKFLKAGAKLQL